MNRKTFKVKNGIVKWFNNDKGFGFIETEDMDNIFVHFMSILDNHKILNAGDRVEFEIEDNDRGIQARSVSIIATREENTIKGDWQ